MMGANKGNGKRRRNWASAEDMAKRIAAQKPVKKTYILKDGTLWPEEKR